MTMRTLGRLAAAVIAVAVVLVRLALSCAAGWIVVWFAFWVSPWIGWPVAVVTALILGSHVIGTLVALPFVVVATFADEQ